jgi:mono/diheme cytochrome c family protein
MHDQPRYEPLERSTFFADGRSARPLVEGTVPRGGLRENAILYTGMSGRDFAGEIPLPVTRELLERGHERYDIYCSPCHARTGDGRGMAVLRGFPAAASLHSDRLRNVEPGYIFDVITRGFGRMPDYATSIRPEDRWAIVAYLRALQVSQNTRAATLSDEERRMVAAGAGQSAAGRADHHEGAPGHGSGGGTGGEP